MNIPVTLTNKYNMRFYLACKVTVMLVLLILMKTGSMVQRQLQL